ncbi:MAG: NAD(P)H-binding protein [Candidatus Eisenbacteria bacterium]|nr:NAD(P)H-binding protein [Candidatus Eisenbacteria bacterium]
MRDIRVRAMARSARRLPDGVAADPRLTVVEADLLSSRHDDLVTHVRGCDAVISCPVTSSASRECSVRQ